MPKAAMKPAPSSAPQMRAESCVVREIPSAATRCCAGRVELIRALRMPMSDGRTTPASAATHSTTVGCSLPMKANTRMTPAMQA